MRSRSWGKNLSGAYAFSHFIQNRKGLAWAVFLAVMLGILIVAFVLWFGKSQGLFDLNELYGILD